MPDLLHPAAPVVPAAPALPVALPAALSMPIDVAVPDEPAPVGDRWPCHLFWAPLAEPLPPVLRPDRAPAGSLLDALGPWLQAGRPMGPLEAGPAYDPTEHAVQPPSMPPDLVELPRASLAFVAGTTLIWGASAGLTAYLLFSILPFLRP